MEPFARYLDLFDYAAEMIRRNTTQLGGEEYHPMITGELYKWLTIMIQARQYATDTSHYHMKLRILKRGRPSPPPHTATSCVGDLMQIASLLLCRRYILLIL